MKKISDNINYIGKNFWKVLPVGSLINYSAKVKKELIKTNVLKSGFHMLYVAVPSAILTFLGLAGLAELSVNNNPIKYNEKQRIIQQMNAEHESEVNFEYSRLFEGNKDSIEVYQKYDFPIKLLEPTLELKEKAIKQSWLENSVN